MLVGMNTVGEITGVIVADHREPYGYFSIDLPAWPRQFADKSIRDQFKVGVDVDAISRATITVTSASRAIRNASRKVARAHLAPPPSSAAPAATPAQ
jgi:NosR/NirI family nitrous oxide reductase transcriptional regulator